MYQQKSIEMITSKKSCFIVYFDMFEYLSIFDFIVTSGLAYCDILSKFVYYSAKIF